MLGLTTKLKFLIFCNIVSIQKSIENDLAGHCSDFLNECNDKIKRNDTWRLSLFMFVISVFISLFTTLKDFK